MERHANIIQLGWAGLVLLLAFACSEDQSNDSQPACLQSGGTFGSASCCLTTGDYPNTCLVGACGCGPGNTHTVAVCNCGTGRCFDGKQCVAATP
ncbi:MAG: hypothetical protein MUF51_09540 [Vicinamibacteria bacterium]|jgi:hypothetical protein|nr:hypothetical protein [Vicinamibacteria bacterium]